MLTLLLVLSEVLNLARHKRPFSNLSVARARLLLSIGRGSERGA